MWCTLSHYVHGVQRGHCGPRASGLIFVLATFVSQPCNLVK